MTRILIVEDEERIVSFLEKGLRSSGYSTLAVSSGADALAIARDGDFDLVLLDLGLPGIDGREVLQRMRARGETMPVVVLTARDGVDDTVGALERGADDYITKPFRFEELLARIRVRLRDTGSAEVTVLRAGRLSLDVRTRRAVVDDRVGRTDGSGVRAGRDVHPARRSGAVARAIALPCVGLRLRPGVERRRRVRAVPAQEAR
jgi:DNA-binding response OmpR family regulator